MTAQWTFIQRIDIPTTPTVITFTGIGSYQAYRLVGTVRDNAGSDYVSVRLNSSTSGVQSNGIFSNGASGSVVVNRHSFIAMPPAGTNQNNTPGSFFADIGFANSTSVAKPFVAFGGWSGNMFRLAGAVWNNDASAVTSISLSASNAYSNLFPATAICLYGRNIA